ncbi:23815_t:CDS:2 [Cetraspora pellucida]|uniref:23815_t:CDS:1 n=1 Tax=Cetraspora pellucida TaxID=1433469 RepID=A0A9N8WA67_9GLOM|nr:23815_t:CDS:2 [Cetraspora pellucida]
MISPLDIWVLPIRVGFLSLYLYIFPVILKEVAYILSLFMTPFMLQLSYLVGYYIFFASIICILDIQDKMINTVTLLQVLQVYRLRTKEQGIYEYIINYIDKVKASNIKTPPTCLCPNSKDVISSNGWCESCGTGMVPGVILPPWTSGHPEINKIIFNSQFESKHMFDHIEWINYDRFRDINEIKKNRFDCVYSALWIDGPMPLFGMARNGAQNVIIKSLGRTPSDLTPEFLREPPFHGSPLTTSLALDICGGERPKIDPSGTPKCYVDLMKKCWDSDPAKRPNINEIHEILMDWYFLIKNYDDFKIAENEIDSKDFGTNPMTFETLEDEDAYYSQFIDLDAISKEEPFEVLDDGISPKSHKSGHSSW